MTRVLEDQEEFRCQSLLPHSQTGALCPRSWLETFLPQLLQPDFVLEPGVVRTGLSVTLPSHAPGSRPYRRQACSPGRTQLLQGLGSLQGGQEAGRRGGPQVGPALHFPSCSYLDRLREMGDNHVRTSMENVVGSDYVGSHW